jgi:hypothetical protein
MAPELPERLHQFILKACHRDPVQRYQDMRQALRDLQPLASEFGLSPQKVLTQKQKMTTLFLTYAEDQQVALNRLMEEFSSKAHGLGVDLKVADFRDVQTSTEDI